MHWKIKALAGILRQLACRDQLRFTASANSLHFSFLTRERLFCSSLLLAATRETPRTGAGVFRGSCTCTVTSIGVSGVSVQKVRHCRLLFGGEVDWLPGNSLQLPKELEHFVRCLVSGRCNIASARRVRTRSRASYYPTKDGVLGQKQTVF